MVVADAQTREAAKDAATRSGGEVVGVISKLNGSPPPEFQQVDELVVQADLLGRLRRSAPELVAQASSLRLLGPVGDEAVGIRHIVDPFAEPISRAGAIAKRTLDVVVATVTLILSLPLLLVAMAVIRLETRGRPIFSQTRVGAHGRRFVLYKLRTMYSNNDDSEHRRYLEALIAGEAPQRDGMYKLTGDPRITRVGRVLRRWSIDELPQLWNVIRGDMSLVGPRPPLPGEANSYDSVAWGRLQGKPGLTCLWQVRGRCLLTFREQVALDLEYYTTWSFWRDLAILAKTPFAVLSKRGAA